MTNLKSTLLVALAGLCFSAVSAEAMVPDPIAVPEPATGLLLLAALGGGALFAKHWR